MHEKNITGILVPCYPPLTVLAGRGGATAGSRMHALVGQTGAVWAAQPGETAQTTASRSVWTPAAVFAFHPGIPLGWESREPSTAHITIPSRWPWVCFGYL